MKKKDTLRGVRIRIYPNREQIQLIHKTFGCVRFLWNQMLKEQQKSYENGEGYISRFQMNYRIKYLKEVFEWLKEVDATSFLYVTKNLNESFQEFFKGNRKYP